MYSLHVRHTPLFARPIQLLVGMKRARQLSAPQSESGGSVWRRRAGSGGQSLSRYNRLPRVRMTQKLHQGCIRGHAKRCRARAESRYNLSRTRKGQAMAAGDGEWRGTAVVRGQRWNPNSTILRLVRVACHVLASKCINEFNLLRTILY